MPRIDFSNAVRREMRLLASAANLSEAPELSESHDSFIVIAYQTGQALVFVECEITRDYGVDVTFASADSRSTPPSRHSFHTFLRMFDPAAALELGRCLPRDQRDMDDLLRLYATLLLKHRGAVFDHPQQTLARMDHICQNTDFANQRFTPSGRFSG